MNLDIENIIVLQTIMKSLSQGVDPTSNIAFPDDTILNSKILQSYFADACEIFEFLKRNIDAINNNLSLRRVTNQKLPFYIDTMEIKKIQLIDNPITISKFVFLINEVYHQQDMKKLKATQITAWLKNQGYLEEIETKGGSICKSATKHGENIGITPIKKVNSRGDEYIVNVYDRNAQEFILTQVIPQICKVI